MRPCLGLWGSRRLPPGRAFRDAKALLRQTGDASAPPRRMWMAPDVARWTELDTLQYLRQTKALIAAIVRILDDMPHCDYSSYWPDQKERPIRSRLPMFPGLVNPQSLERYVLEITSYDYLRPPLRLSNSIGVVTKWLGQLLSPNNSVTGPHLTTTACNAGIAYFLRLPEAGTASQIFHNMLAGYPLPDSVTFHLLLESQARMIAASPYPRATDGDSESMVGHPLYMPLRTIEQMRDSGLAVSPQTWNHVFRAMPMGFGKSFVFEEMGKRMIPLDGRSRAAWLELWDLDEAIEHVLQGAADRPIEPEVLEMLATRLLLRKQPGQANVRQAFKLLHYAADVLRVPLSAPLLNACLRPLKGRRRVDWQLGLLAFFVDRGVQPSAYTWEHLLEAVTQVHGPSRSWMGGTVLCRALEAGPLTRRARVAARALVRKVGVENFLDGGISEFWRLAQALNWSQLSEAPPDYSNASATTQNAASIVGFFGTASCPSHWPQARIDLSAFEPVPRTDSPEALRQLEQELRDPRRLLQGQVDLVSQPMQSPLSGSPL